MIVNYTEEGWEVITQRAHGLLAAQIAMQWQYSVRTERWTETLIAIAEHDDAQVELERRKRVQVKPTEDRYANNRSLAIRNTPIRNIF